MKLLIACAVMLLAGCATGPTPIKIEYRDRAVPTMVAIDPELTAREAKPKRPPSDCVDAKNRKTICNKALAGWLNAYDELVDRLNRKLEKIEGLQPKTE